MLRFLSIKRLAVIDALEIEFAAGLNVLTGETGAGKSILVEAVGLLLGGRATSDLVRTGEESASVEAIFELAGDEIVVRREITAQGRSRAFVNGELATAAALKDLASRLIELHGQHEHHTLLDPTTHLLVLDTFGGFAEENAAATAAFDRFNRTLDEHAALRRLAEDRSARQELAAFQLSELDKAEVRPGEDEELEATKKVLASAGRVEQLCLESYGSLYESDAALLAGLSAVWRRVSELAALDPQFQPYLDARDGIKSQLEDLALFLRRYAESVDASPERLQQVEDRLALVERLKRRHGPTLQDVIAKREALRRELTDLEHADERIGELAERCEADRLAFLRVADVLSKARRRAAAEFSKALEASLGELAMAGTRFDVRFESLAEPEWTAAGIDRVEFFISPNVGEELRPLARIVSGGELSRVMLAIKALTFSRRIASQARRRRDGGEDPPGMVFDEVDAGIGGRVADVVGQRLWELGSAFQVLCITHLPQIAVYADVHFQIEKQVKGTRTHTTVRRLDEDARVDEVSRMLGGSAITDGIRGSAREMLARRQAKGEPNPKGESERVKVKGENATGDSSGGAHPRRSSKAR